MFTVKECLSSTNIVAFETMVFLAACRGSIEQAKQQVKKTKGLIAETRRLLETHGQPVDSLQEMSQLQTS